MFACNHCARKSLKAESRCRQCHRWGSCVKVSNDEFSVDNFSPREDGPVLLSQVSVENIKRLKTGFVSIDEVLGGGLVTGLTYLISGDPGAGKSTLLMQVAEFIGKDVPSLYVVGEESQGSLRLRANRLGINLETILVSDEPEITPIIEADPEWDFAIFDSLHSLYVDDVNGRPGDNTQTVEVTRRLKSYAQETGVTVFIIGHINKDGNASGPKAIEHWVDGTLELSMTDYGPREITINKHRHGPTPSQTQLLMGPRGFNRLEVVSNG